MRVFANVSEAYSEITRDLAKSPLVHSSRVQNFDTEADIREASNYAYTILNFPDSLREYLAIGVELGLIPFEELPAMTLWYQREMQQRVQWMPTLVTEKLHPQLAATLEGAEPAYSYTDRLRGAVLGITELLRAFPDTRRGYWPIFHPEDAHRAIRMTRIPCSLGYDVKIREVNGLPYLHLTYLQRSCDLSTFWFSDIWLARHFQQQVLVRLDPKLNLGSFSHIILSLHSFIKSEIY